MSRSTWQKQQNDSDQSWHPPIHTRTFSYWNLINFKIMQSEVMFMVITYEPWHDKTSKENVRPAKIQISLGIRPVWSESSLSAWRKLGSLATHWVHSEDSDQTGRMPRLRWVFAVHTVTVGFVMLRLISVLNSCWSPEYWSFYGYW